MSARRSYDHLDESDVRIRPPRRGSRPRTKTRPQHAEAVLARVIRVDRGRLTVLLNQPEHPGQEAITVTAMKARELGRRSVVVGDEVSIVGDTSGSPGSLARIVRIQPRRTVLRRTADDVDPVERVIVANVDTMVIVTAAANPAPRPRLVDRCLIAAFDAGIDPVLVVTKTDLADPGEFLAHFAPLGVECITSRLIPTAPTDAASDSDDNGIAHDSDGDNIEHFAIDPQARQLIRARLAGRASVLIGHSGVGKSTLVNALVPGLHRATGGVNETTGRGRHTSTSVIAAPLPVQVDSDSRDGDGCERDGEPASPERGTDGGWIVDTPGIRSFGLAHVDPERIIDHFADLLPGTAQCPRGCSHDELECGLDAYAEQIGPHSQAAMQARLDSLRRLLRARRNDADGGANPARP